MRSFIIFLFLLALAAAAYFFYFRDSLNEALPETPTQTSPETPTDEPPSEAPPTEETPDETSEDENAAEETPDSPYKFAFDPAGDLIPDTVYGGPSGPVGSVAIENPDLVVLSPDMRFPFQQGPAFANSQVFMYGGAGRDAFTGSGGTIPFPWDQHPAPLSPYNQGDPSNYDYPWRDNFCETRSHSTSFCPSGKGHQGQDIRPATCNNNIHKVVATEDGVIAYVGNVELNIIGAETGINYRYLHLQRPLDPGLGCDYKNDGCRGVAVSKGQVLGVVSNLSGYSSTTGKFTRQTTNHLHFEMWASEIERINRKGSGGIGVIAPYADLVYAYNKLLADNPDQYAPQQMDTSCDFVN